MARKAWEGSTRRRRLPADWDSVKKPEAHRLNPEHICHICGAPGGDYLDHKQRGDDHRQENLDWAHDAVAPHCHRFKSSAEGHEARERLKRPPDPHPALS